MPETLSIEDWRPVVGTGGAYEVSDFGRIRSFVGYRGRHDPIPHPITPSPVHNGYLRIVLCICGKHWHRYVHCLVMEAFLGTAPGKEINHKDGDKTNNALRNLEFVTRRENVSHAFELGLMPHGERKSEKLTNQQALEIRDLYRQGGVTQSELANRFGVSRRAIGMLTSGQTWKRVLA